MNNDLGKPLCSATRLRKQDGVIIIWFALFLLTILGFVSLGIDMAKLATTRTQLQNAADAAALAGASAVSFATGFLMPDTARARAQYTSSQNKAFIEDSQPVILQTADISFPEPDRIKVTVRREGDQSIVTHFARVLGITALEMKATATARVDTVGTVDCGTVPLGMTANPGQTFEPGCTPGYILKLPGGSGANGDYRAVRFPSCPDGDCAGMNPSGASTFRCLLRYGYCCPLSQGQVLDTEPGNMAGPTRQAIQDRFAADTDQRQGICYSAYTGNGQRLVLIPITSAPAGGGSTTVTILEFGMFFLKNIPNNGNDNALNGEFIHAVIPGSAGGSAAGTPTFVVSLIQ